MTFQRARQPEQKEQRREAILAAAATLFDEEGPTGAGLNAIAARAGFTKSNVYRYFESREEVLIWLYLAEMDALVPQFDAAILACPVGDVGALAQAAVDAFLARPRLCQLMAILSTVLEQNVSEATVLTLKQTMAGQVGEMAVALRQRLPAASLEDCGWAIGAAGVMVAGMWPGAHPAPVVERVLSRPELAHLKPVPERDLPRALRAILASVV